MVILAGVAEPMSPTPAGLLSWEWAEEAVASWAEAQAGAQAPETLVFPAH